jgi:hypothetical protein
MEKSVFARLRSWPYTFATGFSLCVGLLTVILAQVLDSPMRDPEGFLGPAWVRLPAIGLLFFAIGVVPMAIRRAGVRHLFRGIRDVIDEEWTWSRVFHIACGLLSFYICYVSYRNLKSFLPILVGNERHDKMLFEFDYWLMLGHSPEELLHNLLGTGIAAQILSTVYVSYLMLVPLTLGAFLVLNRDVSLGAWYATALCLNWMLGVVSYYIIPSLGPAFYEPARFEMLPETGVTALMNSLSRNAWSFYDDPAGPAIYGIAGFASLHVSVVLTACLFAERTNQPRMLRIIAWVYFGLTATATIYFGWHFLADIIAGAFIGWFSVAFGGWVTGNGFFHQSHHEIQLTAEPEDEVPTGTASSPN